MVSEDKLIKSGIRYTDKLFEEIKRRVIYDLEHSEDLEEFLARTEDFTIKNPLITTGYSSTMSALVAQVVYNTKFARAKQRQLVRTVIQDRVGHLITNVGEDLKQNVRDIVKEGYDEGLHSREISKKIEKEIDTINRTRARVIARTEVARTQTISDYIVNKERGATSYSVVCRPDCCKYCADIYAEISGDDYDKLQESVENGTNDGRLIGGEKRFSMDNTDDLPPYHPNCRCSVTYHYDSDYWNDIRSQIHVR
jgi:hypothetical protein